MVQGVILVYKTDTALQKRCCFRKEGACLSGEWHWFRKQTLLYKTDTTFVKRPRLCLRDWHWFTKQILLYKTDTTFVKRPRFCLGSDTGLGK